MVFGNGLANIVAALIVALAIIWSGGVGGRDDNNAQDEDYAAWYSRAVGDIRNDIVVNCGCCGDGEVKGERRAASSSF